MSAAPLPPDASYHRIARTDRYRAWKPLCELVLATVFAVVFMVAATIVLAIIIGGPIEEIAVQEGAVGLVVVCAGIAVTLPATQLAALVMGRRPGSLSSVVGRLRWRWLARFAGIALLAQTVLYAVYGVYVALGGDVEIAREMTFPGWAELWPLLVVIALTVPMQAAAEEYVFRGTLMQAVGAWVRAPWIVIAVSALLFAAVHDLAIEGFVAIAISGAVMAYLAIRTGGLEASIALHAINNIAAFTLLAATGGANDWMSTLNSDIHWSDVAIDGSIQILYAVLVVRWSRGIERVAVGQAP